MLTCVSVRARKGLTPLRSTFFVGVLVLAGIEARDALGATATAGIWLSHAEIQGLPMSGPAWDSLKAQADRPAGIPDLSNQDQLNNVNVLAKSLVFVRTGIESYRTDVRQNCMLAIDTELGGRTLALGRELAAYVISADLVGLEPSEDVIFRAWLRRALTEVLDGRTLQSTHEERPNNWGTHAGASRAAVAAYLGDAAELARTALVFKGWLGDRASYAGFTFGDLSWQFDPDNPVAVNPLGATKSGESIDGALPDDMRRGCTFRFPPCLTGYPWGALQGAVVQAEILRRAGYDAWNWQNQALRRAVQFLYDLDRRYGGWWAVGDDDWVPWLVNRAYGTSFPTVTPTHRGKNMAWTDWTHAAPVAPPPAITAFAPTSGPEGTEVTIHGSRFSDVTGVTFNGAPAASFTIDSDELLHATAPAGAGSGPIRITSPAGTATSAQSFVVIPPPTITSFTPASGPVGTEVTVNGSGFSTVLAVPFNGTPAASFAVDSDTQLRATVPAGATSGPIGVTNPAGSATSVSAFAVILPPVITSFTPVSGPAGTMVTVQGSRFTTVTAVTFNGAPAASVTVDSDTQLRATVPAAATSGLIGVTNPAASATSLSAFTVIPPPAITAFTPTSGPAGTQVTIQGSRLSDVTAVTFNGAPAASFTIDSDELLHATAPAGAGSGPIRITSPAGTATSAQSFAVISPPAITSFTPTSGPVGTQVTLTGTGFLGTAAVAFNGTLATQLTVDSNTQIRVAVPGGATTGRIRVTNPAGFVESITSFTLTASLTLTPTDDAYTSSAKKTTNYGTAVDALIRGGGQTNNSYFKFYVAGLTGPVVSARLRLYCNNASPDGGKIYSVSNYYVGTTMPWVETGLTWSKAPAISGTLLEQKGAVVLGTWVEFNVTTAITGNGTYSFGISNGSSDLAGYNTKQATANRPELVIQTGTGGGGAMTAHASDAGEGAASLNSQGASADGSVHAGRTTLGTSHPNPFSTGTRVRFTLLRPGNVRLKVYDVAGRAVRTLLDGSVTAGVHEVPWDGRDDAGSAVRSGVYLLQLETDGRSLTRRLTRMR